MEALLLAFFSSGPPVDAERTPKRCPADHRRRPQPHLPDGGVADNHRAARPLAMAPAVPVALAFCLPASQPTDIEGANQAAESYSRATSDRAAPSMPPAVVGNRTQRWRRPAFYRPTCPPSAHPALRFSIPPPRTSAGWSPTARQPRGSLVFSASRALMEMPGTSVVVPAFFQNSC